MDLFYGVIPSTLKYWHFTRTLPIPIFEQASSDPVSFCECIPAKEHLLFFYSFYSEDPSSAPPPSPPFFHSEKLQPLPCPALCTPSAPSPVVRCALTFVIFASNRIGQRQTHIESAARPQSILCAGACARLPQASVCI